MTDRPTERPPDRTLVLLRHAKAEPPDNYAEDFDRPLSRRGRADAEAAGAWLASAGLVPDQVLCSAAVRTRETWLAVSAAFGPVPVTYEQSLYLSNAVEALELIQATDASVGTLLVIGHNPTMSVLSALLDRDGSVSGDGLHTSGLAVHRFSDVWGALDAQGAPLLQEHTARG
jgi:phosphohistidine phosphatase